MTIHTEKFQNEQSLGCGSLRVIKTKVNYKIVAYVGCEYPEVLASGTIEECRNKWNQAKTWIRKQMGI